MFIRTYVYVSVQLMALVVMRMIRLSLVWYYSSEAFHIFAAASALTTSPLLCLPVGSACSLTSLFDLVANRSMTGGSTMATRPLFCLPVGRLGR